jgi:hypothetical protein
MDHSREIAVPWRWWSEAAPVNSIGETGTLRISLRRSEKWVHFREIDPFTAMIHLEFEKKGMMENEI